MDVFIPLNRSMVEILLNRRPSCLNSNAVAAPASEPDADSADATQEYSPYVPTFQSARPEDPNAQPTFTNENAWQPDYADDDADIPAPTAEEVFADEALEDPDLYLTEEEQAELRAESLALVIRLRRFHQHYRGLRGDSGADYDAGQPAELASFRHSAIHLALPDDDLRR